MLSHEREFIDKQSLIRRVAMHEGDGQEDDFSENLRKDFPTLQLVFVRADGAVEHEVVVNCEARENYCLHIHGLANVLK